LASAVNHGAFRRDLFHRIAEITIQVPPLRERIGDVDYLLMHFLDRYREQRKVRFARESLTILRTYPFFGNVRELENLVKASLIACEGDTILPHHLPLQSMGTLLAIEKKGAQLESTPTQYKDRMGQSHRALIDEVLRLLPENWTKMTYREALQPYSQAFDRIYLQSKLDGRRHNVSQAARDADIDAKTFRKRWKECGLPPLNTEEENSND
jgi:DNA-binding NtrC family response regulator